MHIIFGLILVVFFIAALCVFGVHGWRRVRRERMLAAQAAEMGLKFSREDPFELPMKYAAFSLMNCGHGQNAYNVAHGRAGSLDVQAFDFSYEAGHGFERSTRRYGIIVFAVQSDENVAMWPQHIPGNMPFITGDVTGTVGPWCYCGSQRLAENIHAADSNEGLEKAGACVELKDNVMMISIPYRDERKWTYSLWLPGAVKIAKKLAASAEENLSFQVS